MYFFQMATKPSVVYRNWKSIVHADTFVRPSNISWGQSSLNRDILCFWFRFFYLSKKVLQGFLLVTIFVWIDTFQHQQLAGALKQSKLFSNHRSFTLSGRLSVPPMSSSVQLESVGVCMQLSEIMIVCCKIVAHMSYSLQLYSLLMKITQKPSSQHRAVLIWPWLSITYLTPSR